MLAEGKTIEFKREYTEDIRKTVIAFANTDGGQIFVGVEDNGSVMGVHDPDGGILRITNTIRDSVRPDITMFIDCKVEIMDGNQVIIVEVQRGTARPYYLSGKGVRPEGVFVRQGASTVPATETAILSMIRETSGNRYEIARSLSQQLTFDVATTYFAKNDVAFKDAQKKTLCLIGDDETYTNLALLLSDQCNHSIKLAVFQGSQKTIFRDRCEFSGSLFAQLEDVYSFIDRYNQTHAEISGLYRIDTRDYPTEAIREALLNAIVHRDYGISASTLISIFDDRIEFITIGGLMKSISLSDIMLGVSALRNPNLANVFYRLKLIEAYGTGIPKINECYAEYEIPPNIELSDNAFKITLPNVNFLVSTNAKTNKNGLSERERQVLKLFEKAETIARKDVEQAAGISQATAITLLRDMVSSGLIKKSGSGKNMKYVLAYERARRKHRDYGQQ